MANKKEKKVNEENIEQIENTEIIEEDTALFFGKHCCNEKSGRQKDTACGVVGHGKNRFCNTDIIRRNIFRNHFLPLTVRDRITGRSAGSQKYKEHVPGNIVAHIKITKLFNEYHTRYHNFL